MAYVVGSWVLDDAIAFMREAKGLPSIATAAERMRRCVRACILLSWVALEDGIESSIEDWSKKGQVFGILPTTLKARLSAVLLATSGTALDESQFTRLRKIRNELTHPKSNAKPLDLNYETAEQTFQFCLAAFKAMCPYPVVCPSNDMAVLLDKVAAERRKPRVVRRFNSQKKP
jgi:hypothetical protein